LYSSEGTIVQFAGYVKLVMIVESFGSERVRPIREPTQQGLIAGAHPSDHGWIRAGTRPGRSAIDRAGVTVSATTSDAKTAMV
jgi:hypothetical protein